MYGLHFAVLQMIPQGILISLEGLKSEVFT